MSREQPQNDSADDDREPSLRDTLHAIQSMDSPGVTVNDIKILLGCSADTARRRLNTLFEQGYVHRRKTGQQTLWWETGHKPDDEEHTPPDHLDPVDGPETNAVELIETETDDES